MKELMYLFRYENIQGRVSNQVYNSTLYGTRSIIVENVWSPLERQVNNNVFFFIDRGMR
jgi:hypothetical protein